MKNNLFFNLGRFLRNHPILSIIIFLGVIYFVITDSDEIKKRKNTCAKIFGLEKDTVEYKNCYNNKNSYLAYSFINRLIRNKQTLANQNQAISVINNIKIGVNYSQYRVVNLEDYLKNNFAATKVEIPNLKKKEKDPTTYQVSFSYSDLKPLRDNVYDEKITFLVDTFEINEQKIEDTYEQFFTIKLSNDLYRSKLSNFKIEHKIFSSSSYNGRHHDLDNFLMEIEDIKSRPFAKVFGTFQKNNDRFLKQGVFYIDDVVFFKNTLDDKTLYERSLKKFIYYERIKSEDVDKFLKLIKQDEVFKRLLEVKPNK